MNQHKDPQRLSVERKQLLVKMIFKSLSVTYLVHLGGADSGKAPMGSMRGWGHLRGRICRVLTPILSSDCQSYLDLYVLF